MERKKVILIEDEVKLARFVELELRYEGYDVTVCHDGREGLQMVTDGNYDMILLDLMLPGLTGIEICRRVRKFSNVPIIMLTAKDETMDKVAGLDSGADDYMTKPFSPAELLAHLRALTRRQGEVIFEKLDAGDLSLNLESYDLTCGQKTIHLSFKEFSLAKVLMSNAGQVVSKELLIERVWGVESSAEDNNVEAYVSFLRKKMRFLGSKACIETIRKAGYRFAADGAAA